MRVIDADTHVDETEETWEYLKESERWFMPRTSVTDATTRQWQYFDETGPRRTRDDKRTGTTLPARELLDVKVRLDDMDRLGVETQVIYPTALLDGVTRRPDVEAGLCRAYNSWLADKCAETGGRLRWVASLPALSIDNAVREVAFAKDHGAVGIFKKGLDADFRVAGDPYFSPVYEKANELDIAICIHSGNGDPSVRHLVAKPFSGMWPQMLPVVSACSSLLAAGIPDQFPRLRFGFIEAGSSWVPYILYDHWARHDRFAVDNMEDRARIPVTARLDLFKTSRFYVAYQTHESLALLLDHGLEDCLIIGTDYCHADQSADRNMLNTMRQRAERGEVDQAVVRKMLDDNPRRLYGL
jgi:predicted TIM-barrel fold metal-dependent hydrolase